MNNYNYIYIKLNPVYVIQCLREYNYVKLSYK